MFSPFLTFALLADTSGSSIYGFSADERGWHEAMECTAMCPHLEGRADIIYQDKLELFDLARNAADEIGTKLGKDRAEAERRIAGYSQAHASRTPRSLGGNAAVCVEKVASALRSQTK